MDHASIFTERACALFVGPHAAKRMARAVGCSVRSCEDYFGGRRRLSLDAAIELAGRNDQAYAALLRQVQAVREREGVAGPPCQRNREAVCATCHNRAAEP